MTGADVVRLVAAGRRLGSETGEVGLIALGEVGIGNTTVAAALACGLLGAEPEHMVGLGAGVDADMTARKRAVVEAALRRTGRAGRPAEDPMATLGELGGPEFAVLAGVVLGAAEAGAAVVPFGFAASLAALVAVLVEPGAQACLVAGQRSRGRGHGLLLEHLGCEPLLDLTHACRRRCRGGAGHRALARRTDDAPGDRTRGPLIHGAGGARQRKLHRADPGGVGPGSRAAPIVAKIGA